MMTISVIVGSTRQGRFSERPAQWILQQLHKREGIEGRLGLRALLCRAARLLGALALARQRRSIATLRSFLRVDCRR